MVTFFTLLIVLVAPIFTRAAPLPAMRRQDPSNNDNTLLVLNFADVLNQLEAEFYTQALQKFKESDFKAAGFPSSTIATQQFMQIMNDEKSHSAAIQSVISALGGQPITTCKFDFSSVLKDVPTMLSTARLVENVGVSAFLGAAPAIMSEKVLLDAAATILSVESRHQTVLNVLNGVTAIPSPFDLALAPGEILSIAGGFISGCDVKVQPTPSLAVTNTGTITTGTKLAFKSDKITSNSGLFCQMISGGASKAIVAPLDNCAIPSDLKGAVGVWVTDKDQPLDTNASKRSGFVAGPALVFVDGSVDALGILASKGVGLGNGNALTPTPNNGTVVAVAPPAPVVLTNTATCPAKMEIDAAGRMNMTGLAPDGKVCVKGFSSKPK